MRLQNAAQLAVKIIDRVSEVSGGLVAVALVAMMMLTVSDVTLRYFFNSPITASTEFTEYLMLGVGFLGLAWCAVKRQHIRVEFVVFKFPRRAREIADGFNSLAMLAMSVILASRAITESMAVRRLQTASIITYIPLYPFYWIVSFSFILLSVVMIVSLVQSVAKVVKG